MALPTLVHAWQLVNAATAGTFAGVLSSGLPYSGCITIFTQPPVSGRYWQIVKVVTAGWVYDMLPPPHDPFSSEVFTTPLQLCSH